PPINTYAKNRRSLPAVYQSVSSAHTVSAHTVSAHTVYVRPARSFLSRWALRRSARSTRILVSVGRRTSDANEWRKGSAHASGWPVRRVPRRPALLLLAVRPAAHAHLCRAARRPERQADRARRFLRLRDASCDSAARGVVRRGLLTGLHRAG